MAIEKALKENEILLAAIEQIASCNDYPPAPGHYSLIQRQWRSMVRAARKARDRAYKLRGIPQQ